MLTDEPGLLDDAAIETILTRGELELEGRLVAASNASFLGRVTLDHVSIACVYKPVAGERPLWDFPEGSLAGRERAARVVSEAAGFQVVPPTVLRDGRFGPGMCQRWVHVDPDQARVDVVEADFDEPGWIPVLAAEDRDDNPVLLVHADDEALRDMAVFDVVINNADRKGGHVLVESAGDLWGCDHGVSFHEDPKLRTVLWGWAGEPLRGRDREALQRLRHRCRNGLDEELSEWLSGVEVGALGYRLHRLLDSDEMPTPSGSWPAIPWPAF
ncbi:MAG: SCO1664 family protein [Nocardioidaceae bacterium]